MKTLILTPVFIFTILLDTVRGVIEEPDGQKAANEDERQVRQLFTGLSLQNADHASSSIHHPQNNQQPGLLVRAHNNNAPFRFISPQPAVPPAIVKPKDMHRYRPGQIVTFNGIIHILRADKDGRIYASKLSKDEIEIYNSIEKRHPQSPGEYFIP
ncbi:uncharacterized protein LOC117175664 [Belonocnema kinseyi]|uniref:uncharacterized protein LOC117175664 n=1 Tax=Belonocnema kinseyi TaxID=2817044 RepID=UPI00143D6519|nr:uncharacterized protein LOC117175664 [Belonocnema kinseyi]